MGQSHFPGLYVARKAFAGQLVWTVDDKDLRLYCPLEIDGVIVEGLEFVGRAGSKPDRDCHYMLRATDTRGTYHLLERICWRPAKTHNNKGRGPVEYQYLIQRGAHAHTFAMNWFEPEQRLLTGELPIAQPVDIDGLSAQEAFKFAAERFNIETGGATFPPPPWEPDLFNNG